MKKFDIIGFLVSSYTFIISTILYFIITLITHSVDLSNYADFFVFYLTLPLSISLIVVIAFIIYSIVAVHKKQYKKGITLLINTFNMLLFVLIVVYFFMYFSVKMVLCIVNLTTIILVFVFPLHTEKKNTLVVRIGLIITFILNIISVFIALYVMHRSIVNTYIIKDSYGPFFVTVGYLSLICIYLFSYIYFFINVRKNKDKEQKEILQN